MVRQAHHERASWHAIVDLCSPRSGQLPCLLLMIAVVGAAAAPPTASELAATLQRSYDGVRDFSADFVHATRRRAAQADHRARQAASQEARQDAVGIHRARGEAVRLRRREDDSYIKQDKQVIVSDVPSADQATTPTLFLAGKGNLTRDFTPSLVDAPAGSPPGSQGLQARAEGPPAGVRLVDPGRGSGGPRDPGLVTVDAQGGTSRFSFTNLKENVGMTDKAFGVQDAAGCRCRPRIIE